MQSVKRSKRLGNGHDILVRIRNRRPLTLEGADVDCRILAWADTGKTQPLKERLTSHQAVREVVDHVRNS